MKRILVTGSNGFIGRETLSILIKDRDIEVIALSRGKNRHPSHPNYTYIDADVCDEAIMEAIIASHRPDVVIHTVAMAQVEACEENPVLCREINVNPVRTLVSLAVRYGFHLIYLSTDFIFDGENGPYTETDDPHPLNEYGRSKLQAEQLIQSSSIRWSIVRTILVYGLPHDENRSNIVLWIKNSLAGGKEIKVVTDQIRMPTLVSDLAEACITIAKQGVTGIFHISGEESMSIHDIALQVSGCWNLDQSLIKPVSANLLPSAVARPKATGFILDRARSVLAYSPHSLQDGLLLMKKQMG